jgi:hypothetical protein
MICLGIWSLGFLCYTIFLRMAIPILQGELSKANEGSPSAQSGTVTFPHPH